ncbi:hypothetical protein Hanom_Chr03g00224891 [Helianthus anomalus]
MSSSSSSSSSVRNNKPKIYMIGTDGNVYCNHDMVAAKRVAGSHRIASSFFWKEDVDVNCYGEGNTNLVKINKALQMKIANLEIEKMVLMEENNELKKRLVRMLQA